MKKIIPIVFLLIFILLCFSFCKHEPIIPKETIKQTPLISNTCDTNNIHFNPDIKTIFLKKSCLLCHSPEGGFYPDLMTYDSVYNYLSTPGKIDVMKIKINTLHKIMDTALFYTDCEKLKINIWLNQGFKY